MLLATAAALVASLVVPASASAAGTTSAPAASLVSLAAAVSSEEPTKKPSQEQWKELDKVAKKHSSLGVFGVQSDSGPVLTLPAGTTAEEKAKAVADLPDGVKVTVKTSKFAKGEADKVQKEIMANKWHKEAKKYEIGSFYDGEKDKLVVNAEAPESVTAALKSVYGDKIEVLQTRFEQQTRFTDWEPFLGGSSIRGNAANSGVCSSGFKIYSTHPDTGAWTEMMTTAGHCFPFHQLVLNASGTWMGWMKKDSSNDIAAFLGYDYVSGIWTGTFSGSTASRSVKGYSGMWNGLNVCVSGQTSYQHCDHPITATSYAHSWTDPYGQTRVAWANDNFAYSAHTAYGVHPTQGGDSGAPIHTPDGNGTDTWATGSHHRLISWYDNSVCGCMQYRMIGVKASFITRWGNAQLAADEY
ncbi:hypothetical protein ACWD4T_29665 [Streptomyces umbrinus]